MQNYLGQQIDRYHLLRQLGSGGFGEVYLAQSIRPRPLTAPVALKLLPPLATENLRSFLTEARTFRLGHQHIVRVLDFGVDERTQRPFLVMEYAPHGTLRQRYPAGTRLSLSTVVSLVNQVASALQTAHDEGIVHRDVKPENMLLNAQDQILLSDFGIASLVHQSSTHDTQHIVGTARYMAPELFKGKAKPASDQYALGIVVYEWLCGLPPFQGNFLQLGFHHTYSPVPSLREQVPELAAEIEQVVLRALAKEATQRFVSVQAFATALQASSRVPFSVALPPSSPQTLEAFSKPIADQSTLFSQSTRVVQATSGMTQAGAHARDDQRTTSLVRPPVRPQVMPLYTEVSSKSPVVTSPAGGVQAPSIPLKARSGKRWVMRAALLIGLVVLLSSSLGIWAWGTIQSQHDQQDRLATAMVSKGATQTAILASTATVETAKAAYNAAVARNGIQLGFDATHSHLNPYENVLSTTTVPHLKSAWTALTGNIIFSSPAVANGVVYIGSEDRRLYAFNAAGCGSIICSALWTGQTGSAIDSSPAVVNGVVYVGSWDGKLYAFNAAGCGSTICSALWTGQTGGSIFYSPLVANGVVYVGSYDGKLYAFNATGCGSTICSALWTGQTGDVVRSSPAVANGVVYVGSYDGKLYAFNAAGCGSITCSALWTGQTGDKIDSAPAVANGVVYIGSNDHKLYAFNATGCGSAICSALWTGQMDSRVESSPAVANGVVYIGSNTGKFYAFKATGCGSTICSALWTGQMGTFQVNLEPVESSPTVANGVVYMGSNDHKLYAFNAAGCGSTICSALWTGQTGSIIFASPAVANGVVYVGSWDNKLYAFSL
jgi:eukaryotic-like serine/threonine-protein kinase